MELDFDTCVVNYNTKINKDAPKNRLFNQIFSTSFLYLIFTIYSSQTQQF